MIEKQAKVLLFTAEEVVKIITEHIEKEHPDYESRFFCLKKPKETKDVLLELHIQKDSAKQNV